MSQWGKLDRFNLTGTVTANLGSTTVTTAANAFTAANNVAVGYSLVLGNVNYRIANIVSAGQITLDVAFAASNVNTTTAAIQQSPKDLTTYGWAGANVGSAYANLIHKQSVYGIDRLEVGVAGNKANGISHTGWVHYHTYVDAKNQTRRKSEVLVAMSKNFNANTIGALQTDANDDTLFPDS